jgi:osmotically-inducible protein OsmY
VKPCKARRSLKSRLWLVTALGIVGGIAGALNTGCNKLDTSAISTSGQSAPQVSPTVIAASASLGKRVSKALIAEPKLQGASITVGVSNLDKTVYLSGSVKQAMQEKLALKIAQSVAKDAKIVSQLTVSAPKVKKSQPAKGEAAVKKR